MGIKIIFKLIFKKIIKIQTGTYFKNEKEPFDEETYVTKMVEAFWEENNSNVGSKEGVSLSLTNNEILFPLITHYKYKEKEKSAWKFICFCTSKSLIMISLLRFFSQRSKKEFSNNSYQTLTTL